MRQPRKAIQVITTLTIVLFSTVLLRADLSNGDFEAGGTDWTVVSDPFAPPDSVAVFVSGYARLKENESEYNPADGHNLIGIQQEFSRDLSQTTLYFRYKLAKMRQTDGEDESDVFEVLIDGISQEIARSSDADTVLLTFDEYFGDPSQADLDPWKTATVDLSSLTAGTTYTLTFRLIGDENNHHLTSAFIDDVQLSAVVIPVPGAVLLGSIGLGCAGLRLRRRVGAQA